MQLHPTLLLLRWTAPIRAAAGSVPGGGGVKGREWEREARGQVGRERATVHVSE
jgi:hypothetical protein